MSKNTKSADDWPAANRAVDLLVVVLCLAGMAACLWFFRQDLYNTLSRLNVKPVGTVVMQRRVVHRRFEGRVLWDRLREDALIYSGDFIRTEALSEAAITLVGDDAVTELGENTIIRIGAVKGTGETLIELFGGNVSLSAGSNGTVLVSGKNVLSVAAGGTVSAVSGDNGFAFRVDEGTAVLTGSQGIEETFWSGESSGQAEWPQTRPAEAVQAEPAAPAAAQTETPAAPVEPAPVERPAVAVQPAPVRRPAPARPAAPPPAVKSIVATQPAAKEAEAAEVPKPLPPPGGGRPENGYVLGPAQLRASRNITFSWESVPGASGYSFSLYHETEGSRQLIDTAEIQAPRYVFDKLNTLERGGFVWMVEALQKASDGTLIPGNRAESRFTVDLPWLKSRELPETGVLYGD